MVHTSALYFARVIRNLFCLYLYFRLPDVHEACAEFTCEHSKQTTKHDNFELNLKRIRFVFIPRIGYRSIDLFIARSTSLEPCNRCDLYQIFSN